MQNKTKILSTVLTVFVSVMLVAGAVMAATTIGTNITTTGNLTINTDKFVVTGATGVTSILGKVNVGTSVAPLDLLTVATNRALEVYTTSSSVDGATTVKPIYMKSIMTGAGGVGGRAEFELSVGAVTLGGYANALKGITNFTDTTGGTAGLASAINAELNMPNGAASGAYFPLEINYVDEASTAITPIGSTAGFIYMNATGTVTDFDDDGYFMKVDGLTAGLNHMRSLTSQTLRTNIGTGAGVTRYLVLSQLQDGLGLGVSGAPMVLTAYTDKAINVWTTSGSTDTGNSVEPIYMKSVMTGAGGVGGRANFHMYTNAALGPWANALKGYTEFGPTGSTTGLASAIIAEMKMPGGAVPVLGTYAVLELELVCPASWSGNNKVSFIYASTAGGGGVTAANFDTYGYVFDLEGLTVNENKVFEATTVAGGNVDITHTLRILINGTAYYIPLNTSKEF
jgi:hypothetical protein